MGTVSVLSLPRGAIMESFVQITTHIISPQPPQSSTPAKINDERLYGHKLFLFEQIVEAIYIPKVINRNGRSPWKSGRLHRCH